MRSFLRKVVLLCACVVSIAAYLVYRRYGGGRDYVDVSTAPLIPQSALEVVAAYPEPIGNVAVSRDGRMFFTVHPESRPDKIKLVEWRKGKAVPYPDEVSQAVLFDTPLGIKVDRQHRLWSIDHGHHAATKARLLAFDLNTNQLVHEYSFDRDVAPLGSYLQDLAIDSHGQKIYIADVSFLRKEPGLIVYDIQTKMAWRVLDKHFSVLPQDWIIRTPIKRMVFFGGLVAFKPGVDGIAIDSRDVFVYYATMTHDTLYRIEARYLNDNSLSAIELAKHVEAFSKKPLNDGIVVDHEGRVLLTDVEHNGVMRIDQKGRLETLVRSAQIRWADNLCFGSDGALYIADSAIPDQVLERKSAIQKKAPYFVYRLKLPQHKVSSR